MADLREVLLLRDVREPDQVGEENDRAAPHRRADRARDGEGRRQVHEHAAESHHHRAQRVRLVPGVVRGDHAGQERARRDGPEASARKAERGGRHGQDAHAEEPEADREDGPRPDAARRDRPLGPLARVDLAVEGVVQVHPAGVEERERGREEDHAARRDGCAGERRPGERVRPDRRQVRHPPEEQIRGQTLTSKHFGRVAVGPAESSRSQSLTPSWSRTQWSSRATATAMSSLRYASGRTSHV